MTMTTTTMALTMMMMFSSQSACILSLKTIWVMHSHVHLGFLGAPVSNTRLDTHLGVSANTCFASSACLLIWSCVLIRVPGTDIPMLLILLLLLPNSIPLLLLMNSIPLLLLMNSIPLLLLLNIVGRIYIVVSSTICNEYASLLYRVRIFRRIRRRRRCTRRQTSAMGLMA